MYTEAQQKLVDHVKQKVADFFEQYPVPAHGYDHVMRVAVNVVRIAEAENARSIFLCELAGLLHDIGRVPEHYEKKGSSHHELSYELLREWYTEDHVFDILSDEEKIELLYAVRYHWNDGADEYDTAWLLRDADKLDAFGEIGLQRAIEWFTGDPSIDTGLRYLVQMRYDIRTKTASKIIEDEKLFEPILKHRDHLFKKGIKPIEL